MADRIVLISDDTDFFDYIRLKLELRKSDELFMYSFNEVPEKIHLLDGSLLIINSESSQEKTLELIKIFKNSPSVVVAYNDDEIYKKKCYRTGAFDFITLLTPDSEFRARMIPALSVVTLLNKNKQYRDILVRNKILTPNNEVFADYTSVLDNEISRIKQESVNAVFGAISPDEKSKFLINSNFIETILLNNIRRNDILMNYAPNKYFVLLLNTDLKSVEKLWNKVKEQLSNQVFAGFSAITNQSRQQLINEVLNKLHTAIIFSKNNNNIKNVEIDSIKGRGNSSPYSNFKQYRQEFGHKIEQIISPVFYQMQQKYSAKLSGVSIEQNVGQGYGNFYVKGKYYVSSFRVTSPGFSKINIDITLTKNSEDTNTKRITLEPDELESGLLEDLLEQFMAETKNAE